MKCKWCNKDVSYSNSSPLWNLNDISLGYELACRDCTKDIPHLCPERSKREDTIYTKDPVVAMASMYKAKPEMNYIIKEDGSHGIVMRCSEHCSNAVREVQ